MRDYETGNNSSIEVQYNRLRRNLSGLAKRHKKKSYCGFQDKADHARDEYGCRVQV
jgi:hypothetical protein